MTRKEISGNEYFTTVAQFLAETTGRVEIIEIIESGVPKLRSVTWLPDCVINDSARAVVAKDGKYWHVVGNSLRGDDA